MLGIVTLSLLYTVTIFAGYRHYKAHPIIIGGMHKS